MGVLINLFTSSQNLIIDFFKKQTGTIWKIFSTIIVSRLKGKQDKNKLFNPIYKYPLRKTGCILQVQLKWKLEWKENLNNIYYQSSPF